MTYYNLEVEDDLWAAWKDTVPREMKLGDRIEELIEEDLNND